MEQQAGWMVSGFDAMVALGVWGVIVLAYGLWRSLGGGEQDEIRPAGPLG